MCMHIVSAAIVLTTAVCLSQKCWYWHLLTDHPLQPKCQPMNHYLGGSPAISDLIVRVSLQQNIKQMSSMILERTNEGSSVLRGQKLMIIEIGRVVKSNAS